MEQLSQSAQVGGVNIVTHSAGSPQSRNFNLRAHVNFARVNIIEAMLEASRVKIQLLRLRANFHFHFIYAREFYASTHVKITRWWKFIFRLD